MNKLFDNVKTLSGRVNLIGLALLAGFILGTFVLYWGSPYSSVNPSLEQALWANCIWWGMVAFWIAAIVLFLWKGVKWPLAKEAVKVDHSRFVQEKKRLRAEKKRTLSQFTQFLNTPRAVGGDGDGLEPGNGSLVRPQAQAPSWWESSTAIAIWLGVAAVGFIVAALAILNFVGGIFGLILIAVLGTIIGVLVRTVMKSGLPGLARLWRRVKIAGLALLIVALAGGIYWGVTGFKGLNLPKVRVPKLFAWVTDEAMAASEVLPTAVILEGTPEPLPPVNSLAPDIALQKYQIQVQLEQDAGLELRGAIEAVSEAETVVATAFSKLMEANADPNKTEEIDNIDFQLLLNGRAGSGVGLRQAYKEYQDWLSGRSGSDGVWQDGFPARLATVVAREYFDEGTAATIAAIAQEVGVCAKYQLDLAAALAIPEGIDPNKIFEENNGVWPADMPPDWEEGAQLLLGHNSCVDNVNAAVVKLPDNVMGAVASRAYLIKLPATFVSDLEEAFPPGKRQVYITPTPMPVLPTPTPLPTVAPTSVPQEPTKESNSFAPVSPTATPIPICEYRVVDGFDGLYRELEKASGAAVKVVDWRKSWSCAGYYISVCPGCAHSESWFLLTGFPTNLIDGEELVSGVDAAGNPVVFTKDSAGSPRQLWPIPAKSIEPVLDLRDCAQASSALHAYGLEGRGWLPLANQMATDSNLVATWYQCMNDSRQHQVVLPGEQWFNTLLTPEGVAAGVPFRVSDCTSESECVFTVP